MTDLIVKEGTALVIDSGYTVLPEYGLFKMESNSSIVASVDLTIKARRAEFGTNCTIQAGGMSGIQGPVGATGSDAYSPGMTPGQGGPGLAGGPAGNGHDVTIEAGLATAGGLLIVTNGGWGGLGGQGGHGGTNMYGIGANGGQGGTGGKGGDAGKISVIWTPLAANLHTEGQPTPIGHQYKSDGGAGGNGGPGGGGGNGMLDSGQYGPVGAVGVSGTSQEVQIEWRKRSSAHRLWVQKQDIGPVARSGHAIAWDPDRGRMVLFGGQVVGEQSAQSLGDTWEWDGELWTQVADTGPSPRGAHGMAFDQVSRGILLFGGDSVPGETWLWDGADWVQVADTGPSARYGFAVATDPGRSRVVLFGGQAAKPNTGVFGDTWEWDGSQWSQSADTGPSARMGARMSYNVPDANIVLFGGLGAEWLNDTWSWNGDNWTQIADTGPSARHIHSMASDGTGVILFGGQAGNGDAETGDRHCTRDTWAFYDRLWRQLQDMGPSARCNQAAAYNDHEDYFLMFGGSDNSGAMLGDTWYFAERALHDT